MKLHPRQEEHHALRSAGHETVDEMLVAAGGHGRMQSCITFGAFMAFLVHGAQVMVMAFVGPAVAAEYASEGPKLMKLTGSFFFAGWLVGLAVWGQLAARRGWIKAFACVECGVAFTGVLTVFAGSGKQYLASRFLCGFFEGGVPTTIFGWAGEFLLPADRPFAGVVTQLGFKVGWLLVTLGAYVSGGEHWRTLSGCVSLAALPLAGLALVAPESPRWLLRNGHVAKSKKVLAQIARVNGVSGVVIDSPVPLARATESKLKGTAWDLDGNSSDGGASAGSDEREWPIRPGRRPGGPKPALFPLLFADAALCKVVAVLCFHWFVYSALFFGLSLHEASNLKETAIAISAQIPALIFTAACFDRIGRRATMFGLLTGASVACAAVAGASALSLHPGKLFHEIFVTLGLVCVSGAFSGGYVLSSELLPTDVRATGLATCSQCSRIGGFISPLLLLLGDNHLAVPYGVWASLALAAAMATLWLPETLGHPSLESVDDLHALLDRRAGGARSA